MHPSIGPPGTVSKILWHFTGGPRWNVKKKCQESKPKPISEAFEALCGILRSAQLRVGNYREVVRVRISSRVRDKQGKWIKGPDKDVERESAPVCCVADIPVAHLSYHAARYGRIAIGFHRQAPLRSGFNPVFYSLQNSPAVKQLHRGIASLEEIDLREFIKLDLQRDVESAAEDFTCEDGHPVEVPPLFAYTAIDGAIDDVLEKVEHSNECFNSFLPFIKTFDEHEFSTVYCEREWRSTNFFSFKMDDIAMIVLPKGGDDQLFTRFINEVVTAVNLPRTVPVVPWEDLIEH
jgi:hypothetical protein